jgi:hypothetical protein
MTVSFLEVPFSKGMTIKQGGDGQFLRGPLFQGDDGKQGDDDKFLRSLPFIKCFLDLAFQKALVDFRCLVAA